MNIAFGFALKSYFRLPVRGDPFLSPYDLESIILRGIAFQPRITPLGIMEGLWIEHVEGCENTVFLTKDKYVCDPVAGLSHEKSGVALSKGLKGYKLEIGSDIKLEGDFAAYSHLPGAIAVALYDPPYTHIAVATPEGSMLFERAYKGKPKEVSIGYKTFSVSYEDGRSQLIYANKISEVGFPAEGVAFANDTVLAKSSGWLIWLDPEMPKPMTITEKNARFVGFYQSLPVFKVENKLYRLEGGALVKLDIGTFEAGAFAYASDSIVIDSLTMLTVYDINLKPYLEIAKDPSSKCFAFKGEVFCCSDSMCGFVERGESTVYAEAENHRIHRAIIESKDMPLFIYYKNDEYSVEKGERFEISEEKASILDPYYFELELKHLLGSYPLFLKSEPLKVDVEAEAQIFTSSGRHECGGSAFGYITLKKANIPERIKLFTMGKELLPNAREELCLEKLPENIDIEALDILANAKKIVASIKPSVKYIPSPEVSVEIKHLEGKSIVKIESNAEVRNTVVHCRNGDIKLNGKGTEVKECVAPAYLTFELHKNGFIYSRRHEIVLKGLPDFLVNAVKDHGLKEYREGGFIAKTVIPMLPEINPLSSFKLSVGKDVVLRFKSKVVGRIAVLTGDQALIKTSIVKPGLNEIALPFSPSYIIVFYSLSILSERVTVKKGAIHERRFRLSILSERFLSVGCAYWISFIGFQFYLRDSKLTLGKRKKAFQVFQFYLRDSFKGGGNIDSPAKILSILSERFARQQKIMWFVSSTFNSI